MDPANYNKKYEMESTFNHYKELHEKIRDISLLLLSDDEFEYELSRFINCYQGLLEFNDMSGEWFTTNYDKINEKCDQDIDALKHQAQVLKNEIDEIKQLKKKS